MSSTIFVLEFDTVLPAPKTIDPFEFFTSFATPTILLAIPELEDFIVAFPVSQLIPKPVSFACADSLVFKVPKIVEPKFWAT